MALKVTWKKNQNLGDEELMGQFQKTGDLEVLGALFNRYMHLVYGVCLKYLEDREDARDAVTSIFEKLIIELPKHEIENFKSWLHVLSKNFCLMHLRSKKSADQRKRDWENEQDLFMEFSEEMHPIDEENSEMNKILQDCIKKLKEEQAKCIRLFYYENKSYKEIVELTKMDEKKVKSYIQNGKRNLKICIENSYGKRA